MLDELTCELPACFFEKLNGGVNVLEQAKRHPQSRPDGPPLYIMGEYTVSHTMGRCIYIYYGSFLKTAGACPEDLLRVQLRSTLRHEFRHHLESLAGSQSLALEDQKKLKEYLSESNRSSPSKPIA